MSDGASPQKSDDVLSLIRRLVVEKPIGLDAPTVQPQDVSAAPEVPLLVLMPAQRVEAAVLDQPQDAGIAQSYLDRLHPVEPLLLLRPLATAAADGLDPAPTAPEPSAADPAAADLSASDPSVPDAHDVAARSLLEEGATDAPFEAPVGSDIDMRALELGIDPQELRDLLRDLIREELAGSLGTRMTRNIRKLVRAEIARELALRAAE